jgi:Zn-dependent protease with chaperone function
MTEPNFICNADAQVGSLVMIAIILTAFVMMLGILKPADVPRRIGVILGVIIALMLIPSIFAIVWSAVSLWHRLALAAIVLGICLLKRPRRESRKR